MRGLPQAGLDFLTRELKTRCRLEVTRISLIQYDPECPFAYNNFLYDIEAERYGDQEKDEKGGGNHDRFTHIKRLIGRIANPAAEGLDKVTRVESSVAAMTLARQALKSSSYSTIIPEVYAWSPGTGDEPGWVLLEYKAGVQMLDVLQETSEVVRTNLFRQVAEVFAILQQADIPETVQFGGLRFDAEGRLINGRIATCAISSAGTYAELLDQKIHTALAEADDVPILDGWRTGGLREQVEDVVANVKSKIEGLGDSELGKKALVHSDLNATNLLVDANSSSLTALLDFDFAYIGGRLDEYTTSFIEFDGQLVGPMGAKSSPPEAKRRHAMLTGHWVAQESQDTARAWNDALRQAGAVTPASVAYSAIWSGVMEIPELLCPRLVCNHVIASQRSREQLQNDVVKAQRILGEALTLLRESLAGRDQGL